MVAFAVDMLDAGGSMVAALLVLHALAAIAGLVVPRILGALVDQAAAPGTPAPS